MKILTCTITPKTVLAMAIVALMLPSLTKATEVHSVEPQATVVLNPLVWNCARYVLAFMTVKVAEDLLIDYLQAMYGDGWKEMMSQLSKSKDGEGKLRVIAKRAEKHFYPDTSDIDDFTRAYK